MGGVREGSPHFIVPPASLGGGRWWRQTPKGEGRPMGHCVAHVQKVQKVPPAFGRLVQRGGWYRRFAAISICTACVGNAAGGSENQTTAPAARGNAPLWVLSHHFPRRGKFYRHSASRLINISMHRGAKISPSGEDVADRRQKGCISIARQGGWLVFL